MNDLGKYFKMVAAFGRDEIMKQPEQYDIYCPYVRLLIDGACDMHFGFEAPMSTRAMSLIREFLLAGESFKCAFAFSESKGYNMVLGLNTLTKYAVKDRYLSWLDADAPRLLSMPSYLRELEYCKEICKEYAE